MYAVGAMKGTSTGSARAASLAVLWTATVEDAGVNAFAVCGAMGSYKMMHAAVAAFAPAKTTGKPTSPEGLAIAAPANAEFAFTDGACTEGKTAWVRAAAPRDTFCAVLPTQTPVWLHVGVTMACGVRKVTSTRVLAARPLPAGQACLRDAWQVA